MISEFPALPPPPSLLFYFSLAAAQLGHNGVTPESCWLVDELSVAVPTKGIKYIFPCKCWLAKDRGDGLTVRLLNVLDSSTINIIRKVSHCTENMISGKPYQNTEILYCLFFIISILYAGYLFSHSCHWRHSVCRDGYKNFPDCVRGQREHGGNAAAEKRG